MSTNTSSEKKHSPSRGKFSGHIGYVISVAASAVGLGNIWRFPYLAAKYGGGMFLLTYLILTLTFGYTLIISETALGRMTKRSPVGAFGKFGNGLSFKLGGWVNAIIPMLIVPYYSVIGGWVLKYLIEYCMSHSHRMAGDSYFSEFIVSSGNVEFYFVLFALLVFAIIMMGVKSGVERMSKIMMPILIVLAVIVSIYSMTRPGALAGVKYFLIPNLENFSWMTLVAAMGQMFYSLSIAMGILYTYGSYLDKDIDIEKSTSQVEIFDTAIAMLAGLMIIPAVFAFSGGNAETLQSGPSLMFITLPKVFDSMGFGSLIGIVFFLLVLFAALTSAVSLAETSVSTIQDELKWSRKKSTLVMTAVTLLLGTLSATGYGALDFIAIFGMPFLDFFDFLTNSIMMPIAAIATCWLVVYKVGFKKIEEEVMQSSAFKRRWLYTFFAKWLAPIFLLVILASSIASILGIITL